MKTYVDQRKCIACGHCCGALPDVFEYNKNGLAYNKLDNNSLNLEIDKNLENKLCTVSKECPSQAINIE